LALNFFNANELNIEMNSELFLLNFEFVLERIFKNNNSENINEVSDYFSNSLEYK